jgi:hypothetical protein
MKLTESIVEAAALDRLQTKLEDLNPKIPLEGLREALRNTLLSGRLCVPFTTNEQKETK